MRSPRASCSKASAPWASRYTVDGVEKQVRARREVIVSSGAFGSPQVLLLSGVGPAADLQKLGIPVVHDLPGVGENLQDHIDHVQSYKTKSPNETFGLSVRGGMRVASAIPEWKKQRTGLVTSNFAESGGFVCSSPDVKVPDLQLVFVVGAGGRPQPQAAHGPRLLLPRRRAAPLQPRHVKLASRDPTVAPVIDPKFLDDERDLRPAGEGRAVADGHPGVPAVRPVPRQDALAGATATTSPPSRKTSAIAPTRNTTR